MYMYVFVEESFMKRTEVSRTTDWEATCENMLRSWVMFERSGDSLKSWRTRLQADGTAFEMVLGTGRMEEGFRGCTGKSQGLQMGKSVYFSFLLVFCTTLLPDYLFGRGVGSEDWRLMCSWERENTF